MRNLMKTRNEQYLSDVANVESIYAIRIKDSIPHFVGWGETTSSGNFRIASFAFPVLIEDFKTKIPNDAILESEGWKRTSTYCDVESVGTFLLNADEDPHIFSLTVEDFQSIVNVLKDGDYVFIFEDNTSINSETRIA